MILADPDGSVLAPYVETGRMTEAGSWAVEGIGEDFVPPNADLVAGREGLCRSPTRKASPAARELLRAEGVLAGSSSGTLLAAALRYCRAQTAPKRVVSLVCDSGAKYLSKVFNPTFLAQEGWTHRSRHGTVRDVVVSRATAKAPPSSCVPRTTCARYSRACAPPTSRSCRWSMRADAWSAWSTRATCSPRCSPIGTATPTRSSRGRSRT